MTMPSKIYAVMNSPRSLQLVRLRKTEAESHKWGNSPVLTYTRADIAEGLAQALEALLESPDQVSASDAIQALARYHAIIH